MTLLLPITCFCKKKKVQYFNKVFFFQCYQPIHCCNIKMWYEEFPISKNALYSCPGSHTRPRPSPWEAIKGNICIWLTRRWASCLTNYEISERGLRLAVYFGVCPARVGQQGAMVHPSRGHSFLCHQFDLQLGSCVSACAQF